MAIQSVSQQVSAPVKSTAGENVKAAESEAKAAPKQDSYEKGDTASAGTYKIPKSLSADEMKSINASRNESYQNMLRDMMGTQAKVSGKANGGQWDFAFAKYQAPEIPTTQEGATSAISENGPWGINAVATRLMDMAVALSGGDSSKADTLREAVKKGFAAAGVEFGQELPSICHNTLKEVMNRFDYWEANGSMDGYTYGGDKQYNSAK